MTLDPGRVQAVFLEVLEHENPADRATVLIRECAGDDELRRRVEALLIAHDQPDSLLDRPFIAAGGPVEVDPRAAATTDQGHWSNGEPVPGGHPSRPIAEGPGSRIGPYKLLQLIGEGGMGSVYMAEQEKPVRRRVALKIIKPGMDSARVIARFEAERQALAMMDHQSIARVLDAGATETGRPFFVMELVHGVPITQYCDQAQLTPTERLELFIPVCRAIQHAHQKGIIHRDIKPSNVLVTLYDGEPVPKVIDFGIAKAIDQRLTERTMFTEFGAIVGTLEYMSPEQAEMSGIGVDTRSDIYSLGVLLYELMTGSTPLERAGLHQVGYVEILRRIKEDETPTPSKRLSDSGDTLASISARRGTEASKLSRSMRGELDWIVMRALEKDRSRRYESASGFARDIQNYLADEPVEACPPSASYRLRKIARKHRLPLAVASAFAAVLVLGAVLGTWQAIRATRAEGRAKRETERARLAADESKTVLKFFQDQVLAAARPEGLEGGLGREVTIRRAVDAAEPKIASAFEGQPTVEASVRQVLGKTYSILGEPSLAIRQLERSRGLRAASLGPEHLDTLTVQNDLALGYWGAGRLDLVIPLLDQTLAAEMAKLGPDHPDTLTARNDLAVAYLEDGQFDRAILLLDRTLAGRVSVFGPDHVETLLTQHNLAGAYRDAGRLDPAIALFERTLATEMVKLGPDHPTTLLTQNQLAVAYQAAGRLDEAISLHERTLAARRAKLGLDHPATLITQNNLALAYHEAGDHAHAEPIFREVLELRTKRRGADHPHVAETLGDLGCCLLGSRRYAEAEVLTSGALKIWLERRPDAWIHFQARSLLGASLLGQERYAEAEPLLVSGFEGMKSREAKIPSRSRSRLAKAGQQVVQLYEQTGREVEAAEWRARLQLPQGQPGPRP